MARKIGEKSGLYRGIGTGAAESELRSDLAPGIGTRISAAADTQGSRKNAADVMEVSTDSLQRYIREEVQAPFAAVARLALASGLSLHWLATGEDAPSLNSGASSHDLSEPHLTIALELADRAVGIGWLPRPLYARLVRLIYQGVSQGLPVAEVEQFAAAVARKLAQGETANGGESGLGKAGGSGAGGGSAGPSGAGDR